MSIRKTKDIISISIMKFGIERFVIEFGDRGKLLWFETNENVRVCGFYSKDYASKLRRKRFVWDKWHNDHVYCG